MIEPIQQYIAISKYARWIQDLNRRETWEETCKRYIDFWKGRFKDQYMDYFASLEQHIYNMDVMPSMRCLMTAGKALTRDEIAEYNCSSIAITHIRCFDEIFFLALNGVGTGFSVERQYIAKLPDIAEEFYETDTTIVVRDSKIGWSSSLKELISLLYQGMIPKFDLSKVRPAGSRLKTFGGRASGPAPLNKLFKNVIRIISGASGRKLNSLECHDICCHILDTVIVGGVRRSAGISFSNLSDDRMRRAKTGQWWMTEGQRALANNSVMYTEKPDLDSFSKEWRTLHKSKSGERGIVNQVALKIKAESCGREYEGSYILNPCGEAILRDSGGLCNLSEVIIRPNDTLKIIMDKIEMATIIGTFQATLTNFRYLRKIWQTNAEEEALLGVSLTGIMDHKIFSNTAAKEEFQQWSNLGSLENVLDHLRDHAEEINVKWAEKLGINPAGQVTLVKPSGTTSILTNTSSGIHPRYSKYFIRRVRQSKSDPLTKLMVNEGVPFVDDNDKLIFSFYLKSPDHSVLQKDVDAISQLELWKIYKEHWCDGNPSQTIYYTDDEFFSVADWIWKNWDIIGGLSFFPKENHIYQNAPLEEITETEYEEFTKDYPVIDWSKLVDFEKNDTTTSSQTVACAGDTCELIG